MPYDDPTLSEFDGYFTAKEPGRRERAENWATAIGLQKVDGLRVSRFLVETAKDHIEGRITQNQAKRRIHDYYEAKDEVAKPNPETEEPDKVAERIAAVLSDGGFEFTPEYFISIHAKLFKGIIPTAGKLRTVNIRKHEWVLKGSSVTYGDKASLKPSLIRNFADEREFDYGGLSPAKMIPHFSRFIARIWQVHPFGEGNTRTTAVFAVKYLNSLGFNATNNPFKENSWYFRNALVRANYADYERGVTRDWSYLEAFFRNLILGENNELKSRYLLIGLTEADKAQLRKLFGEREAQGNDGEKRLSEKGGQKKVVRKRWSEKGGQKKAVRKKRSEKGGQKTVDRILELIADNPRITQAELLDMVGIHSRSTIQKHIANLKAAGRIRRVGPDKGGHWEAVISNGENKIQPTNQGGQK